MTLATVGADGRPSTRIVLIKGFDARGIVWFTNYESRKGRELAIHPFAALQFHWVELERVVRIEGTVEKVRRAESDAYFDSRPLDSRIGAWASPQSQVIASRATLVANAARYGAQFMLKPPRPPHWGGYRLRPRLWEFWQGRKSRLHDRLRYRREKGARLARPGASGRGTRARNAAPAHKNSKAPAVAVASRLRCKPSRARCESREPSKVSRPWSPPSSRGPAPGDMRANCGGPLGPADARYLPESGYSTISGRVWVLIDRYLSGASEVLMIWCG